MPKNGKQGEGSEVQPASGHFSTSGPMAAPLRWLSLVLDPSSTLGSCCGASRIAVPPTRESFAAVRDLLSLLVLPTLFNQLPAPSTSSRREHGAPSTFLSPGPLVPSRGKQSLFSFSVHRTLGTNWRQQEVLLPHGHLERTLSLSPTWRSTFSLRAISTHPTCHQTSSAVLVPGQEDNGLCSGHAGILGVFPRYWVPPPTNPFSCF